MSFAEFWEQLGLNDRHTLYILYGSDDQPLYIGRTRSLEARLKQHYYSQEWIHEVLDIRLIHDLDAIDANILELVLIAKLSPKYNVMGKGERADIDFEEVHRRRERLGWSQVRLSREASVAKQTIVNLENGHYNPRWETLEKIMDALDNASSS
jgi:DNA-binding XRE family transcriptional regulator